MVASMLNTFTLVRDRDTAGSTCVWTRQPGRWVGGGGSLFLSVAHWSRNSSVIAWKWLSLIYFKITKKYGAAAASWSKSRGVGKEGRVGRPHPPPPPRLFSSFFCQFSYISNKK